LKIKICKTTAAKDNLLHITAALIGPLYILQYYFCMDFIKANACNY